MDFYAPAHALCMPSRSLSLQALHGPRNIVAGPSPWPTRGFLCSRHYSLSGEPGTAVFQAFMHPDDEPARLLSMQLLVGGRPYSGDDESIKHVVRMSTFLPPDDLSDLSMIRRILVKAQVLSLTACTCAQCTIFTVGLSVSPFCILSLFCRRKGQPLSSNTLS